ncbi:Tex family protein [Curvivirga aplysinae]|uniref:Tex family protein n=1 Tax=Curvivirga aplysinae TaxID=2529852 RepID=UPI0012BC39DC|nr:Tex family protein [Curvivirga aplysinae]MTI10799.1 RNA-binding transcriptional accessory protein [Curvivirga aplysinae]
MAVQPLTTRLAKELEVREAQIASVMELLDGGATVPFIARYRKEVTGGLDDAQLRKLEERLGYMRELDSRRETILKSIDEQGKLTDELRKSIEFADSKSVIEDLYLPYKPKRRTKAQIAREAGLEPLANDLFDTPTLDPEIEAAKYLDDEKGVADVKAALDGARQILVERFAEDAALVGKLRDYIWTEGKLTSKLVEGKAKEGEKFADYFDYEEPVNKVPSHRALAIFRGRKEEILQASIVVGDPEDRSTPHPCEMKVATHFGLSNEGRAADKWLQDTARWAWRIKLSLYIEMELMRRLWEDAEEEAILVFAKNLRDLLLAAPAGSRPTLALDPGFRTGVKVAVVDATGKLMETTTIYPHQPQQQWDQSLAVLAALCLRFNIDLVAIGNGTASRETEQLANELKKKHPELKITPVMVSEAGASVYSASEFASRELPDVDVSLRGAASIGRRLQDPLAELVKIDPKSIGVGQYQHDVSEFKLNRMLDTVVEDCVNAVGVDLNTASAPLLARVAGVGPALAESIVAYREANGAFANREDLKAVPRLGDKAFEQCAGFLKVMEGDNPLDRSSVHPEAYPVVEKILTATNSNIKNLMGDASIIRTLAANDFTTDKFGEPTVKDILQELEKPGRDPRPEFKTATFQEGVEEVKDLKPGMRLEGVVTNVANFGAFVDVGVHQDGLVHVSALADRFVSDPREVVKPGDIVQVKVMEVDIARKRISLSMRMGDSPEAGQGKQDIKSNTHKRPAAKQNKNKNAMGKGKGQSSSSQPSMQNNAFAAAFAKAQSKKK